MKKKIYILIGPQGSGKTHWAKNILLAHDKTGIVRISQDEQGRDGHRREFQKCINSGISVVIDRMNFNREQRNRYVQKARYNGYYVTFVWFNIGKDTCIRRLATRKGHPTIAQDDDHNTIVEFYFKEFESPCSDEYDEMLTIGEKGRLQTLDLHNRCFGKRVIVVGDIHGCYDKFIELLDKCEYLTGDIVVATGDLVDRGPKIRETLLWFRNTPGAYCVEGNHENKLRRYLNGNPVTISNGLDLTISQCSDFDPVEWGSWLKSLPHIIRLQDVNMTPHYVVHAGIDGRKWMDQQRIETCLYARNLDGVDFFDESGIPWWKTLDESYVIMSGHIISENPRPCKSAYCLDGGAYMGGKLRALIISNDEYNLVEVGCSLE